MSDLTVQVANLFQQTFQQNADNVERLPQSGGDRIYFRIINGSNTFIATANDNIAENNTFIYCTGHFKKKGLPVPEIFGVNQEHTIYLQQDFGVTSLLDVVEQQGHSTEVFELYKQTLEQLSQLQIKGNEGFNYDQCLTAKSFGKQAIMSDLLYFKYYFLDTIKLPYDKQALLNDFETLSTYLNNNGDHYFMYRDFQSRNVMVSNGKVNFIDYQGGMKGALQYDVASLLWQAKANLPQNWKARLLEHYIGETEKNIGKKIDQDLFISQYNGYVLIRLLQVLGAYGFRGLFERKAHFLFSIPLALRNLSFFVKNYAVNVYTPELIRLLQVISEQEIVARFETIKANENTSLLVKVYSFSYKQNLPPDDSGNGGGFLFDMRGILNPGRFAEYKKLTGRDKLVKDFLEQKTKMISFLDSVYNIVDIAVEDYLQRGFANLLVGFGCTGGQHRSVYAADALARHLRNKFGVRVAVSHLVQDAQNWVNEG